MPRWRNRGLFLLSGILSYAATPPHGLGFLAFFSLIPFCYAVRGAACRRDTMLGGFLAGAAFFIPGVYWLTGVTLAGYVALALYCSTYFIVFALVTAQTSDDSPMTTAVVLGAAWTLLEYVRGFLFTGFPWLMLSHTQADFTIFTQILDVIGSYALSGVLVTLNVLLYQGLKLFRAGRARAPVIAAVALFATVCTYGIVQTRRIAVRPLHRIAAVQASVPQEMKETLEGKYDPGGVLTHYLVASQSIPSSEHVDVVVWPETVVLFPFTLNVNPKALSNRYAQDAEFAQSSLRQLAQTYDAYLLVGATTYLPATYGYVADRELAMKIPDKAWQEVYNSAALLDSTGSYVDRYDKMHLVPFGEYIPLPNLFPFLARFVPFDESLIRGERQTIFSVNHHGVPGKFGVLICYEDTDPELARGLRQAGADYLINVSNDAWFGPTEMDQHFVTARFRAIENRTGVVRSGNNGITAIIDPFGRVERAIPRDLIGHLAGQVSTTDVHPFYSRTGDLPALIVCGAVIGAWVGKKRRR